MKNTEEALKWIVNIVRKHKIPFEIRGGFAAKIYGSTRELADIDIQIKNTKIESIILDIKNYVIFGPKRYKDRNWDLLLLTLRYKGQVIDISGLGLVKIFNKINKKWENLSFNPSRTIKKEICNIQVPVISVEDLIKYKNKLRRRVDLQDVKEILETQK